MCTASQEVRIPSCIWKATVISCIIISFQTATVNNDNDVTNPKPESFLDAGQSSAKQHHCSEAGRT